MSKFKVGDKVRRIKDAFDNTLEVGEVYIVSGISPDGRWLSVEDILAPTFRKYPFEAINFEKTWTPEKGEMILVGNGGGYCKREFLCMDGSKFVCRYDNGIAYEHEFKSWGYAKPVPETHTITIDGKEIEISEESYIALKDSLCGDE